MLLTLFWGNVTGKTEDLISIIIPVFNEQECLHLCFDQLKTVLEGEGYNYELIFVNDGSTDRSLQIIKDARQQDARIRLVDLSRNFGHQIAITAGMDYANGEAAIIMDADMQDPPEVIVQLVEKWKEGYDVVHARRTSRLGESWFKKCTASFYYKLLAQMSDVSLPQDVGDFRLISARVVQDLRQLREKHRYVRGLVAWVGYKQSFVEYIRQKRVAGKTKYDILRMLNLSRAGITAFSVIPLRLASLFGFLSAFGAAAYLLYALYIRFVLNIAVPGWTSVIMAVLMIGGIQLICLGIMGEYIGLLYEQAKGRPLYLVNEVL